MKRRRVIAVLIALLMLATTELAARNWWKQPEPPADLSHPFWSAEWQAAYRATWKAWQFAPSGNYSIHPDDDGLIKYRGGYRITTGQPRGDVPTLWMFGSSTLLSLELDASETIPSFVQASVGGRYRVINTGFPGAMAFNQRKRMENLPVKAGDWVVFYDGLVDMEVNIHRPIRDRIGGETCAKSYFALYHVYCAWIIPQLLSDADIERGVAGYRAEITKSRRWAVERGACFLHVLQPHTWAVDGIAHERELLWDYPGLDVVSRRAWPTLQRDETGLDLTHVLDTCKRSGECWHFPFYHLNGESNRIIAIAIVNELAAQSCQIF